MNKVDGRRISAAEAWLTDAVRARPNLTILPDTLVRRVLFAGRRVVGVEVERRGAVERVEADRVVLCGGAVHTPGILLRSGVGPEAELTRLRVDKVAHVPGVGHRLLDHPGAAIFFRPLWGAPTRRRDPIIQVALRYQATSGDRPNDMQIQPGSCMALPWTELPLVSIMGHVGKPVGTGTIRWPSADPRAAPTIESNLLVDARDRDQAIEAMRLAMDLAQRPPLREIAAPLWPRPRTLACDAKAARWIVKSCDSGYHPSGTVPMGPDSDPLAATDGRGKVRGTEGLWVGDASLMPTIPVSNIHLPSLMVAERIGGWLAGA
jgi:choline dehydrogenase